MMQEKIRLGMIGGGPDAKIGHIHRMAARMDNHYELVAGAFSRDYQKSLQLNVALGLNPQRIYPSYEKLFEQEKLLPEDKRIEAVSIVTPNDSHYVIASEAIKAGFHVIIDKPVTASYQDAKKLNTLINTSNKLACVTYTYSGYALIKEMKHFIQSGKCGSLRKVIVNFTQGWLATCLESDKNQNVWRMDPHLAGGGTLMDIGTHAFHLAEYITGLRVTNICAEVSSLVPQRQLDDDSSILLRFENDARGLLIISQAATGDEVEVSVRVYGEKASLHWSHDHPNMLMVKWLNQPTQIFHQGNDHLYLDKAARSQCRTSSGHPEGYLEAFANHYRNFALCLMAIKNKLPIHPAWNDYPKIEEGLRGVAFVERVLASAKSKEKWLAF